MHPTVILSTGTLEHELAADTGGAARFRQWREATFVRSDTFVIDGQTMTIYLRRADGARRAP
jgi:hypothetical protein